MDKLWIWNKKNYQIYYLSYNQLIWGIEKGDCTQSSARLQALKLKVSTEKVSDGVSTKQGKRMESLSYSTEKKLKFIKMSWKSYVFKSS